MAPALGRMTVLVEDYEEALEYYTDTLGLEVIADRELENGFRALHVGTPGRESVGL